MRRSTRSTSHAIDAGSVEHFLDLDQFRRQIEAGPIAVVTGAGLSTASGIPAYRDENGTWRHPSPIQHQAFLRDEPTRRRYWARSFVGWQSMASARPNLGHDALASLQLRGVVSTIITQNVDGLHQQAGSDPVIELHGSVRWVRCLECGSRFARALVQGWLADLNPDFAANDHAGTCAAPDGDAQLVEGAFHGFAVPDCPQCNGLIKPDVVFFGDNVPRERVARAVAAVDDARALLVVGSTLTTYSGLRFARQAHESGKPVVAINRGVTRADGLLALKIEADCGDVLQRLDAGLAG